MMDLLPFPFCNHTKPAECLLIMYLAYLLSFTKLDLRKNTPPDFLFIFAIKYIILKCGAAWSCHPTTCRNCCHLLLLSIGWSLRCPKLNLLLNITKLCWINGCPSSLEWYLSSRGYGSHTHLCKHLKTLVLPRRSTYSFLWKSTHWST